MINKTTVEPASPFELKDDCRFIAFETAEQTFLLPYIGLRKVTYTCLSRRENSESDRLEFQFDSGQIVILGRYLNQFLPLIQQERLSSIRAGLSLDLSLPEINSVTFSSNLDS